MFIEKLTDNDVLCIAKLIAKEYNKAVADSAFLIRRNEANIVVEIEGLGACAYLYDFNALVPVQCNEPIKANVNKAYVNFMANKFQNKYEFAFNNFNELSKKEQKFLEQKRKELEQADRMA